MDYRRYHVSRRDKAPLLDFISEALVRCGCRMLHLSTPDEAPFRLTFETADGERMGIITYAFYANSRSAKNRPADEHRFQVKYGSKDGALHALWQDAYELYTTLSVGINPERKFFVAADPILHSPTRFFISIEFKEEHAQRICEQGWYAWERDKRTKGIDEPVEILVGGTAEQFLRYVRFERAAKCCGGVTLTAASASIFNAPAHPKRILAAASTYRANSMSWLHAYTHAPKNGCSGLQPWTC